MTTLTAIRPGRNSDWMVLVLESGETLDIPVSVLFARGLSSGETLDDGTLADLRSEAESARVRAAALHLIAFRARSRGEVETRLQQKGFTPEPIRDVVDWLEERGYLDDEAFAVAFVRDRIRFHPRGRRALLQDLFRKGIRGELAERAIVKALEAEELSLDGLARTVAEKWLRSRADRVSSERRDPRLYAHLARKGFAPASIHAALDALASDLGGKR